MIVQEKKTEKQEYPLIFTSGLWKKDRKKQRKVFLNCEIKKEEEKSR